MVKKAKTKVCKDCGYMSNEKTCPNCGSEFFIDKYKGKAIIFDAENSKVAETIKAKKNGSYALKYG